MTLKKFFVEFKKVAADFKWQVDKNGLVRATKNRKKYCPLTALCFSKTQKYFRPENITDAVDAMRVSDWWNLADLCTIILIADNMEPLLHPQSRALLLGICGLTEIRK